MSFPLSPEILEKLKFFGVGGLGIVAIVALVWIVLRIRETERRAGIILLAIVATASIFLIVLLQYLPSYGWTSLQMMGDAGGKDFDCSPSSLPERELCTKNRIGAVAVCWEGTNSDYPGGPAGDRCRGERLWCTYKSKEGVSILQTNSGSHPGAVYVCASSVY